MEGMSEVPNRSNQRGNHHCFAQTESEEKKWHGQERKSEACSCLNPTGDEDHHADDDEIETGHVRPSARPPQRTPPYEDRHQRWCARDT